VAESVPAQEATAEEMAEALITAHDGNVRAALVAPASIVQSLKAENRALRGAAPRPASRAGARLRSVRRHDGGALAESGDAFHIRPERHCALGTGNDPRWNA
jgi:hypothetical protein